MKLSELISSVHKDERVRELKLRKDEVKVVIEVLIDHIVENLFKRKIVKLYGLFTLKVKKVKGRRIAHPQTKEEMHIDDYYKVSIEPSKRLKDGLESLKEE